MSFDTCLHVDAPPPLAADPYFGLLTNPPGQWGLVTWARDHGLVIKGGAEFRARSLNFLGSFVYGEAPYVRERDEEGNLMLTVSLDRLLQGLSLWFYTQLYGTKARTQDVLDAEDGDTVIDTIVLNEPELDAEAAALAESFVESISGTALGLSFHTDGSAYVAEHRRGSMVPAITGDRD